MKNNVFIKVSRQRPNYLFAFKHYYSLLLLLVFVGAHQKIVDVTKESQNCYSIKDLPFFFDNRPRLSNWEKSILSKDGIVETLYNNKATKSSEKQIEELLDEDVKEALKQINYFEVNETPIIAQSSHGLYGALRGIIKSASRIISSNSPPPTATTLNNKTTATASLQNHERHLWPIGLTGYYEIPYLIKNQDFSQWMKENLIFWAMQAIEQGSNVRFRPATSKDKNMIVFINGEGCLSMVGRHPMQIPQRISLNIPDCMHHHSILHEILHALGFYHEHQRSDSNEFIEPAEGAPKSWIEWMKPNPDIPIHVTPYNLASIMHYNLFFKAKNAQLQTVLDTRTPALSSCDWHALNLLYPGRLPPPPCIPHEHIKACEPLKSCPYGDVLCPYMCGLDCDSGLPRGDVPDKLQAEKPFCQFVGGKRFPPLPQALQLHADMLHNTTLSPLNI